jgi:hypothetical protein
MRNESQIMERILFIVIFEKLTSIMWPSFHSLRINDDYSHDISLKVKRHTQ